MIVSMTVVDTVAWLLRQCRQSVVNQSHLENTGYKFLKNIYMHMFVRRQYCPIHSVVNLERPHVLSRHFVVVERSASAYSNCTFAFYRPS